MHAGVQLARVVHDADARKHCGVPQHRGLDLAEALCRLGVHDAAAEALKLLHRRHHAAPVSRQAVPAVDKFHAVRRAEVRHDRVEVLALCKPRSLLWAGVWRGELAIGLYGDQPLGEVARGAEERQHAAFEGASRELLE